MAGGRHSRLDRPWAEPRPRALRPGAGARTPGSRAPARLQGRRRPEHLQACMRAEWPEDLGAHPRRYGFGPPWPRARIAAARDPGPALDARLARSACRRPAAMPACRAATGAARPWLLRAHRPCAPPASSWRRPESVPTSRPSGDPLITAAGTCRPLSSEEIQALYDEAQHLEAHGLELARQESSLSAAFREATAAAASLRDLEGQDGAGSRQALVPLGLGTFAKATLSPGSGIVVTIGAGAAVEKDARSALNFIERRIKEIEVTLQGTNARRTEVMGRLDQVQQQLGSMARRASSAPAAAAPAPAPAARTPPQPVERA